MTADPVVPDPGWEIYASSRLRTPSALLAVYGALSLWTELAFLAQNLRGMLHGVEPLLRREFLAAFVATNWAAAGCVVHLFGVGTAATALVTAWHLQQRRSLRLVRITALGASFGAMLLPFADVATLSCCAVVPATVLGLVGVFGGLLASLALADEGVKEGFRDA